MVARVDIFYGLLKAPRHGLKLYKQKMADDRRKRDFDSSRIIGGVSSQDTPAIESSTIAVRCSITMLAPGSGTAVTIAVSGLEPGNGRLTGRGEYQPILTSNPSTSESLPKEKG